MKRNIKLISMILVLVMILGVVLCGCGAKEPKNAAYVTLTDQAELAKDKSGNYLAAQAIEVPEAGTTVGELLTKLHKDYFKDGEAGYATTTGQYGEMITKLWGVENGGSYGYYINGNMAMGLTDPVKPGDRVDVFIYKDAAGYSDAFIYMTAEAEGDTVKVTVQAMGFDANWNPVMKPLANTKIYYAEKGNLTGTGSVTDADGTAILTLKNGTYKLVGINTDGVYTVTAQKLVVKK